MGPPSGRGLILAFDAAAHHGVRFLGHPIFPTGRSGFNFLKEGASGLAEKNGITDADGAHAFVLHEVLVEKLPIFGRIEIIGGDEFLAAGIVPWVNVELNTVFEKAPKRLEDTAGKIGGPFAFKEFVEEADTEDDADGFFGVTTEVSGNAVKLRTAGDENGFTKGLQGVGAVDKFLVVEGAVAQEIVGTDFTELNGLVCAAFF